MTREEYFEQYKDPRWQKMRLKVMNRDKWACTKCGEKELTLNVHHKKPNYKKCPWEYLLKDLTTLCEDCHDRIEFIIKDIGKIDFDKIKIMKLTNKSENTRILFVSLIKDKGNMLYMAIYNKTLVYSAYFEIDPLEYIKEIINHTINGKD